MTCVMKTLYVRYNSLTVGNCYRSSLLVVDGFWISIQGGKTVVIWNTCLPEQFLNVILMGKIVEYLNNVLDKEGSIFCTSVWNSICGGEK